MASAIETDRRVPLREIQRQLVDYLVGRRAEMSTAVDFVLAQGALHKASDIHFEAFHDVLRVRYRIDGFFQDVVELPADLHDKVISRLKVMANLPAHEKQEPMDGRISVVVRSKMLDFRISTVPTVTGEKAVVRIFDPRRMMYEMDQLGFSSKVLKRLEDSLLGLRGAVMIAGPASCGKTTTAYALLQRVHQKKSDCASIISVEDPVECHFGLFPQMEVNLRRGMDFAKGLRAILRQAPEVIFVGEIRDLETCEIAMQASLTGHLLLCTIHSATACEVVTRLLEMGIEPYIIASAVTAVVALRLIRKVCKSCAESYKPDRHLLSLIEEVADPSSIKFVHGAGCPRCLNSGYSGRTNLSEVLTINDNLRRAILDKVITAELRKFANEAGMESLFEDGVNKIKSGLTTIEEVVRVLGRQTAPK